MTVADTASATGVGGRFSLLAELRSPALLVRESLAGTVTTLALIPEVISFSDRAIPPRWALMVAAQDGSVTMCDIAKYLC